MSDEVVTKPMVPVVYGADAAFQWAARQLCSRTDPEQRQVLLLEALYTVVTVTGDAGLGALMLFVEEARDAGEGEDGR